MGLLGRTADALALLAARTRFVREADQLEVTKIVAELRAADEENTPQDYVTYGAAGGGNIEPELV